MSRKKLNIYHIHNTMMNYSVEKFLFTCIMLFSTGYVLAQADAGEDKAICPTESVEIGTDMDPKWCYFWEDDKGNKSFPNTPKITVTPTETTKYTVTVTGEDFSFKDKDEVKVIVADIKIKKLEFLSDHNKLCDGADILTPGSRFPDIEWDKAAGTNAPITHTSGDAERVRIRLTLEIKGLSSTPTKITGTSAESALKFEKTESLSDGASVTVELTATDPIKHDIRIINSEIDWKVEIESHECPLEKTGPHKIFTTVGSPINDESGSTPNVTRMETAISYVLRTMAHTSNPICYPKLIWEMNNTGGSYYLGRNVSGQAWRFPSVSTAAGAFAYDGNAHPGADCITISTFFKYVSKVMGVPGSFNANIYMAHYRIAANPVRPKTAIAGSLNTPKIRPGDVGTTLPPLSGVLTPARFLYLADGNCAGGGGPGEVGCAGGINAFEAALEYTHGGTTWYIPGGTNLIYKDKDHVVQIFASMAWTEYADHDSDPTTPNQWVVRAVDYKYTPAPIAALPCP
jgi:hypothetical protein